MVDATSAANAPVDTALEPIDDRRFRAVAIIAGILYAPQLLGYVLVPFMVVPTFREMYGAMGGTLPPVTAFILSAGPALGIILGIIGALVWWLFYRLAGKYWIGLLFAPFFAGGLLTAPLIWMLYAPMFDVITLVQ